MDGSAAYARSVETRTSWVVAIAALVVLSVSYGAPLATVVALKPIAAEFGAPRSAPALAVALTFIGAGCGGIAMGWLAERIGVRWVVIFGGTMIGAGLTISSLGDLTQLYISSFLLVGLLGASGMFAPLMTYVCRWFDRRRGTAIALLSAGQYIAGALSPALFQFGIDQIGWRHTMLAYAAFVVVVILPLAAIYLRRPPDIATFGGIEVGPRVGAPVLGLPPNLVLGASGLVTSPCDQLRIFSGEARLMRIASKSAIVLPRSNGLERYKAASDLQRQRRCGRPPKASGQWSVDQWPVSIFDLPFQERHRQIRFHKTSKPGKSPVVRASATH